MSMSKPPQVVGHHTTDYRDDRQPRSGHPHGAEQNGCVGFFWKPIDGDTPIATIKSLTDMP
jgi:hypothetical protein